MRVVLDPDLCQGHAECEFAAPEVFSVPRRGVVEIQRGALPDSLPDTLLDAVREAVRNCPTRALRLED
ncbi:ferredoxin [Streptosporangium amethystogenes]|uniref:ferredoxin n=1 Tax=Streptosporangium amethystogenes TaxID=2002 RepID=UPI0004C8FC17|nr:ferredoxin [Streptosporangium amethystogenes]